jgi:hypothetical protein
LIAKLEEWLLKARTLPDIQKAIIGRLKSWCNDTAHAEPTFTWPGVNDIVRLQDRAGWKAFLEGAVLNAWTAKQQEYYNWIKRKNTGKQWTITLIKKMWETSWNMWEQQNGELNNLESPASIREHMRLDTMISNEYTDQDTLSIRDRRWFRRPKEVIFTEAIEYKQQWLESVGLARTRYNRQRRTSTQAQRILMRTQFPRNTNNTVNTTKT